MTGSDEWAERWTPLPAPFSKYEVFSDGTGPDQRPVRRIGAAALSTTVNNHGGYLVVKPYDDGGKRQTKTVHSLVLLGFAGPCPPGMESRHLDDDPLNNRWRPGTEQEARSAGGNLVYGTKRQQHADKVANGNPPVVPKSFPCVNHVRCGGMVANQGSRCLPCAAEVGRRAAVMLGAGMNLGTVTRRLGYKSQRWVHGLARDHGGYTRTLAEAQAQREPWLRRVTSAARHCARLGRPM
ncbi:MAG TPA: hypothetical protein VGS19_20775 [Streptosporangiaceae bacterium]|nr:hypothetical protein [Streptosporangiaceae bacterium]